MSSLSMSGWAQTTQPCIVKQYNQKRPKTPLAGVEVMVTNADSTWSASDGRFTLTFRILKPGDKVKLISAKKTGFELFNSEAVEQWNISRNSTPFTIVLVKNEYFSQLKGKLKQSSTDSYKSKHQQAVRDLEQQKKTGKLKEEEFNKKYDELEERYQKQFKNLDNYIDQFARIDLSEVSDEEQRILELVEEGKIDDAVKAYEDLNISGKLRQARENKKALSEAKAKIEEEENRQDQAIDELKAKQKREIATLKLAGGMQNYDKIARILKENASADTNDIEAVMEYARFAYEQKDFKEAEKFLLICLNHTTNDIHEHSTILQDMGVMYRALMEKRLLKTMESFTRLHTQDSDAGLVNLARTQNSLGGLYCDTHNYAKAEDHWLKALENYTLLLNQNPDEYREYLADIQHNLGCLYCQAHDYIKAEEYLHKALKNYTPLFLQNPDASRADLATIQNSLGILYSDIRDYAKAEEFLFKALGNYTLLFDIDPDTHRVNLAYTQNNLGRLYSKTHDYAKAEEFLIKALGNHTRVCGYNLANCAKLAKIQNNLGILYSKTHNYAKAEEFLFKALENHTLLFDIDPDAFRANLAFNQNHLGALKTQELATYSDNWLESYFERDAKEFLLKALKNYTLLFYIAPDAYRADLANTQVNLGQLHSITYHYGEEGKAKEYFLKAQENYTELFGKYPNVYRADLANTQNIIGKWCRKSRNFSKSEKYHLEALENYIQLFARDSDAYRRDLANTHNNLGHLYKVSHFYTESKNHYLKALENCTKLFDKYPKVYHEDLADAQQNLGYLYLRIQNYTEAEEYYFKALENYAQLCEKDSQAYLKDLSIIQDEIGSFFWKKQDYTKAEEYWLKALEYYDKENYRIDIARTQNNLGDLYRIKHAFARAKEYLLKAQEIFTELERLYCDGYRAEVAENQFNLGNLFSDTHDYAKAEEYLLKALNNYTRVKGFDPVCLPRLSLTQECLRSLYEKKNNDVKAKAYHLQAFLRSLSEKKNNKAKAKEYHLQALDNFNNILKKQPDDSDFHYHSYYDFLDAALFNCEILYLRDKDYQSIIVNLRNKKGRWCQRRGDTDEAMILFESAYQLDPEKSAFYLASGYNSKAYEYAKANDLTKAIETIDRAIAIMPEETNYYDSKGEFLLMKGDEQEAVKMWQKVMELDPDFLQKHEGETDFHKQLKEKGLVK